MSPERDTPPPASLKTTSGSVRFDSKAITAHGKERSRFATTCFAGTALVLLIVIYGVGVHVGKESQGLLALIGTVFGIFVGRVWQRGD